MKAALFYKAFVPAGALLHAVGALFMLSFPLLPLRQLESSAGLSCTLCLLLIGKC